jgi:hypothetical protein
MVMRVSLPNVPATFKYFVYLPRGPAMTEWLWPPCPQCGKANAPTVRNGSPAARADGGDFQGMTGRRVPSRPAAG